MASAKQIAANHANAQKSTGPRTELGKLNSRLNAVSHGLTGQVFLKTAQQDEAYNTYRARLYPDLDPANAVELDFAERIIYDSWRIHRASAIESNLYAIAEAAFDTGNPNQDDALNDAHTFQLNDKTINLLSLYQQRLQRGIRRDLEMLRKMQKERKSEAAKPAAKPVQVPVQVIDFPTPQPVIGSVYSTPPADPAPPPQTPETNPENMAA
jgi:hypothetical protein